MQSRFLVDNAASLRLSMADVAYGRFDKLSPERRALAEELFTIDVRCFAADYLAEATEFARSRGDRGSRSRGRIPEIGRRPMINPFRDLGNDLRRQGAVASRARGAVPPTPLPNRYSIGVAIGACLLGAIFSIVIVGFVLRNPTVLGHIRAGRISALDRLVAADVDVADADPLEFRAFHATAPDERAALIKIARIWSPAGQALLVDTLRRSDTGAETFQAVARLASRLADAPGRKQLVFAVADVDESDASRLAATVDVGAFIRQFVKMPADDARLVLQAGFPIVPNSTAKADLVRLVLDPAFSASAGDQALRTRAGKPRTGRGRRSYLRDGAPLKYCKAVPCAPEPPPACYVANWRCPDGYTQQSQTSSARGCRP